jgi:L-ascorbate metabolism protein UlaG (beta-lactamase superfamily)
VRRGPLWSICIHEVSEWMKDGVAKPWASARVAPSTLGGAKVTMVNATHSASIDYLGGPLLPAGSCRGLHDRGRGPHRSTVSGDTDIMADMAWMGELPRPDIGILSCGGHYTMDMERAAWAARKWFNFRWVIPCHYRTFDLLAQDASVLKAGLPPGIEVIEPTVLDPIRI